MNAAEDRRAVGAVSDATVARLPLFLQYLVELAEQGDASVSSERLAELSGVNPATVRRDLAGIGITGTRGVGYDADFLRFQISQAATRIRMRLTNSMRPRISRLKSCAWGRRRVEYPTRPSRGRAGLRPSSRPW